MRLRSSLALVAICCVAASLSVPTVAQVKVSETTLSLPVSDEAPPDENPPFDYFAQLEDYPYTMRQNIRTTESVHAWRALVLENEYLKCTILPQLGGHIYTCVDKINGKPMFYANPTLKKANIAYRGAWAAFGEEFNFPISHNWVSISPIDWAYSTSTDGSASVTVGNRDRVDGMDWSVQIVLRPKSTVLEEHVTLFNRSDLRHRFFWWNNAGIQIWPDTRIYYPMQFVLPDEATTLETWPIDHNGKDLSLVSNQTNGQISFFAYGSLEPFMGVYNPHTASGVVHWADPKAVPAKKLFTWGSDTASASHLLSDNHSVYLESQSGLFPDQQSYEFLAPRQAIRFSEYWMPVRDLGVISEASLSGVVALHRVPTGHHTFALNIALNVNHSIPGATILVSDGASAIVQETASLDPAVTWKHQIPNAPANTRYTFLLKDANGNTLLTYTEGVYKLLPRDQVHAPPQPHYKSTNLKDWSAQDFLDAGTDDELQGNYGGAWDNYQTALQKYPSDLSLLKATGRLGVALYRFQDASSLLGKAESLAPQDPEIHYDLAIAESTLDHQSTAQTELETAHQSPSFQAPAGLLLAELMARNHKQADALNILQPSCPAALADLRCVEETVALQRTTERAAAAKTLVTEALTHYPTNLFLRVEAAKLGVPPNPNISAPPLDEHLAADTNRILNLVREYDRIGLYTDALDLLTRSYPTVATDDSEPGAPQPSSDPRLAYYRGYCRERLGQSGAADYVAAAAMPLLYIFPNNPDDFAVLRAALASNPLDASAHFLLGSLFVSKEDFDPGLDEWRRAESLNPKIPSLQENIARLLLEVKQQPQDAAVEFQRGMQIEPANPALYLGLNEAMRQLGRTPAQRVAMLETFPDSTQASDDLIHALVDALRQSNRNSEADAVQAHRFVLPKGGAAPLQPQK
jgi:tetratricopeptide (TPR) repeat protein